MSALTLSAPDPLASPRAVVRNWELRFLDYLEPGERLELEPGQYVVSLTYPGGEEQVRSIELGPGEEAAVAFEQPAAGLESMATAPPLPWHGRLLAWTDGAPAGGSLAAAAADGDVDVTAQGLGGPVWIQIAVPGGVPRSVLVPDGWSLGLGLGGDLTPDAVPPRADGMLSALTAYLVSGQLREAADLGAQAMEMLRGKVADPIGATVGGYALLRMARVDLMHDWPYNLSSMFGWLPDGAVIAAELALLQNRRDAAASQLKRAAGRGVPLFADGLSLLGRRVREGLVDTKPARRLAKLTPFMELGRLTVALPGRNPLDPAGTQRPLERFPASDGWRSFVGAEEA